MHTLLEEKKHGPENRLVFAVGGERKQKQKNECRERACC